MPIQMKLNDEDPWAPTFDPSPDAEVCPHCGHSSDPCEVAGCTYLARWKGWLPFTMGWSSARVCDDHAKLLKGWEEKDDG